MFWRKKTRLEKAQEAGARAIEQIQDALHQLPIEQWQDRLEELKENAGHLAERTRSSVAEHAGEASSRARHAAEKAQTAADLAGKKEALQGVLSSAQKAVESRIQRGREHMEDKIDDGEEMIVEYVPEQEQGSKWLWIVIGMLVGAVIALLIAPASGRRSRALLRDKLSRGKQQAEEMGRSAGEAVSNAANRVTDAAQELPGKVSQESQKAADAGKAEADDETIADRVRTELGQNAATQDLERINVSCCAGVVTLHGPQLNAEQQQKVEEVARAVPGVREVQNELDRGQEGGGSDKEKPKEKDSKQDEPKKEGSKNEKSDSK